MIENTSADDRPNRGYLHDVADATATDQQGRDVVDPTEQCPDDAKAYVREVVGVKGTSDEPALDVIEYVQYVTSEQWRRQKQPTNIRFEAAMSW